MTHDIVMEGETNKWREEQRWKKRELSGTEGDEDLGGCWVDWRIWGGRGRRAGVWVSWPIRKFGATVLEEAILVVLERGEHART